ncbi:MAG: hypothetical protein ACFFDQ_09290 [Candidatus Thorarchaeota archaeon]
MTNEKSRKILVESEYITRCNWCGTPYSPDWVSTQQGKIYCSIECQSTDQKEGRIAVGVCFSVLGVVLLSISFYVGVVNPYTSTRYVIEFFMYGVLTLISGFCLSALAMAGQSYEDRKDKYRDSQLLVCEYCNHICTPGVVDCDNCGASLVDAQYAGDSWPEWFVPPKPKRKFGPCRYCGKSFNYPVSSADGNDRCPKCGKIVLESS